MNPALILTLITTIAPLLPQLASSVSTVAPGLSGLLTILHPAASAQPANLVSLIQQVLNEAQAVGYISFGKPLVVDGKFGGSTFGAIKALQAKLGLVVQEPAASAEMDILGALFSKL